MFDLDELIRKFRMMPSEMSIEEYIDAMKDYGWDKIPHDILFLAYKAATLANTDYEVPEPIHQNDITPCHICGDVVMCEHRMPFAEAYEK